MVTQFELGALSSALTQRYPVVPAVVRGLPGTVFDCSPRTLLEVHAGLEEHGDLTSVVYQRERWTYGQQQTAARNLAGHLQHDLHVLPGDRVGIAMRNLPEWAVAFWAAQLVGAVVVPLNAWHAPGELLSVLRSASPRVVVADEERVHRLLSAGAPVPGTLVGVRTAESSERVLRLDDLTRPGPAVEPPAGTAPEDPATIIYTSGTTGRPKGVVGSHRNHTTTLLSMRMRAELADAQSGALAPPPPLLLAFPLFHVAGLLQLLAAQAAGRTVALLHRWDLAAALALVGTQPLWDVAGPPLVVRQVVEAVARGDVDAARLRNLSFGGAPAPADMLTELRRPGRAHLRPALGYGLTETTSSVLSISGADLLERPTSIGRPLPTVRARIVDPQGHEVAPEAVGELQIAGPQVCCEYFREPELTAQAFDGGWFRTGDLARCDGSGFYHLVGRLKDVVVRGGENVPCAEVEQVLSRYPGVQEAAVFGRPHPELGEEVVALVHMRPGLSATAESLRRFVGQHLAAYKVPADVGLVDDPLPRTETGKLQKAGLRLASSPASSGGASGGTT